MVAIKLNRVFSFVIGFAAAVYNSHVYQFVPSIGRSEILPQVCNRKRVLRLDGEAASMQILKCMFFTRFPERSKKEHTCKQYKIVEINRNQTRHPEVLKGKHLFSCSDMFLDAPT